MGLVIISLLLIGISKIPDFVSTWRYLSPAQERNPIMHLLMLKFKLSFKASILAIALIYYGLLTIEGYFLYLSVDNVLSASLVLTTSLIVSYFQLAAYLLNAHGKVWPGLSILLKSKWYSRR